jgi:ribose transport system substrate-binding protein
MSRYPEIKILDEQPADSDVTRAARIWEALLNKYPKIDAAYFHTDDMALAAYKVMKTQQSDRNQGRRQRRNAAGAAGGA